MIAIEANSKIVLSPTGVGEGGTCYMFVATEDTLRNISSSIDRLSSLSHGAKIDFRVTMRNKPEERITLAFAKCSDEKLLELQAPGHLSRFKSFVSGFLPAQLVIIIPVVMLVGIYHCLVYFSQALLWLLSFV